MLSRRHLLASLGVGGALAMLPKAAWPAVKATPYAPAGAALPPNACDCHVHVFEPGRFPYAEERVYTPEEAGLPALKGHLERLQIKRVVLVQPSPYGSDNRCMLDAIGKLGGERARGVAVVGKTFTPEQLQQLHAGGVRGLRVNLETYGKADPQVVANYLRTLAEPASALGWHLQMYTNLATVKALHATLAELPVPVVLDHFGHLNAAAGFDQPGYAQMIDLLERGNLYVKLSALYRISTQPGYADAEPFVKQLAQTRPDRLLWASDWPHTMPAPGVVRQKAVIERFRIEDDGFALDRVMSWLGSAELHKQVLADNPARLYWGT